MLYHPNVIEIFPLIQKAIAQWPNLLVRARSAEALLLNFDIRHAGQWQIRSQSADHWYAIAFDGKEAACNCPDFVAGGARAAGRKFCKHSIAWLAYKEILNRRLNHHLQAGTFQIERLLIDYWVKGEIGSVQIVQDGNFAWWKLANAASVAKFAAWLGDRQDADTELTHIDPVRRIIKIEVVEYPIRGHVAPECADAACMSYEDWREIHGPGLAVGQDEARRPYAY